MSGKMCLAGVFARDPREGWPTVAGAHKMGYRTAILIDQMNEYQDLYKAADIPGLIMTSKDGRYAGWSMSNNIITKEILRQYPECDWVAYISDDTTVDPNWHADHIALQLEAHFGGTYGICQPTGCRWGDGHIDRIAGSPIIGREWCERAHGGLGPFFPPLLHMFADEALTWAAEREGVYLRRPDLTHDHRHFKRVGEEADHSIPPPKHLEWCNTREHWDSMQAIFEQFKVDYDSKWRPLPEKL